MKVRFVFMTKRLTSNQYLLFIKICYPIVFAHANRSFFRVSQYAAGYYSYVWVEVLDAGTRMIFFLNLSAGIKFHLQQL